MHVVDEVQPNCGDADLMDREWPTCHRTGRHVIRDAIAAEHRDPTILQPPRALGMQTSEALKKWAEGTVVRDTACVSTGRHDDHVARLDDDPLLPQKGTGLGLPLARMMVELHGGTLTIDSEVGKGTRVVVRLPADRVVHRPVDGRKPANGAAG